MHGTVESHNGTDSTWYPFCSSGHGIQSTGLQLTGVQETGVHGTGLQAVIPPRAQQSHLSNGHSARVHGAGSQSSTIHGSPGNPNSTVICWIVVIKFPQKSVAVQYLSTNKSPGQVPIGEGNWVTISTQVTSHNGKPSQLSAANGYPVTDGS